MSRISYKRNRRRVALMIAAAVACVASLAASTSYDSWNDKTILKFSSPVMIPGATLQPGSYVFKLMNSTTNRHLVQVTTEDGAKVVALAQAVPTKRAEAKGEVVMQFNPTDAGSPPAIKGWFYPGSIYGHEFIYPEEQARHIAQRTKTIVLSVDVPGSDLEKGTIRTIDPAAVRAEWRGDPSTMREWNEWQRTRAAATTAGASARGDEAQQASAPMIKGDFKAMRVKLDDLEDNPTKYIGQTVSVDAEIEDVFGPRLFTIDEPNWGDLQGEILVFMPTTLAALARENDRVTITGTVKTFVKAEVEREWGWLGLEPDVEVEFAMKPVLVASRIVGGNNNSVMIVDVDPAQTMAVGTSGGTATSPLTDLGAIARGDQDLVGRQVRLTGARVDALAKDGGFFAKGQDTAVFVLPAHKEKVSVRVGDTVSLDGVVLQMPRHIDDKLNAPARSNDKIYVFATNVNR